MDEKKEEGTRDTAACFMKAQLESSERYREQRDLIAALLEDGKAYTLDETDNKIKKYLKGKVE